DQARTYNFGFAHYLDMATGAHEEITLPIEAAFEAMKGMYVLARRDSAVDVHAYFDCALRACSRDGGHTGSAPVAAAASA
uniref:hypothetical protein n=1 Tax=Bacillus tropicus TaxID=2026188 RepID=UPI0036709377